MSAKDAASPSGYKNSRRKSQIQEFLEVATPRRKRSSADVFASHKSSSRRESSDRPPRESPASNIDSKAASLQQTTDSKRFKNSLWPEFTDIDSEKWDASNKGKDVGKLKSPVTPHFEDPDGKIEMPPSLIVDSWKRPIDMSVNKSLVVVDLSNLTGFDLVSANEHLHDSEVMRHIISQIITLWDHSALTVPRQELVYDPNTPVVTYHHSWRPWEHIYALCKSGKGAHMPLYNQHGKYIVRLYFMGCWRKIAVDDSLPYDNKGRLLLPSTTHSHELWPMLLTKGLIKIAALDYKNRGDSNEFYDFNVLHHLTGWHPEIIPVMSSNASKIWSLLQKALPVYDNKSKKPKECEAPKQQESTSSIYSVLKKKQSVIKFKHEDTFHKEEKKEPDLSKQPSVEKPDPKAAKDKAKCNIKDKDKKDKLDKDRSKEKTSIEEEKKNLSSKDQQVIIYATYWAPNYPIKVSQLGEMASASEKLRQIGLSYLHPHPIFLSQTRSIPLEPPPPEVPIPPWKLIRPRKKKATPSDEPVVHEEVLPIESLELSSPFLSYKINPISIPSTTTRPKSTLERGGGRSRPSTANPIEETDETLDLESSEVDTGESAAEECSPVVTLEEEHTDEFKKISGSSMSKNKASIKSDPTSDQKRSSSDGSQEKSQTATSYDPSVMEHASPSETEDKATTKKDEETDTIKLSTLPELVGSKSTWIDFKQFCTCFKVLYVYHKPTMYQYNSHVSDFKPNLVQQPTQHHPSKMGHSSMQGFFCSIEDKSTQYLFIDSLSSSEIVVSFSCLSRWNEGTPNPQTTPCGKIKENDANTSPNLSNTSPQQEQTPLAPLIPGNLAVEPYSWKSLVIGCPVLKLRTSAIRAAVLSLPPGRHVLRFLMTSNLGYSVHLFSSTPFTFGDEETIMALCTRESCRFIENATQVIHSLGRCIQFFNDRNNFLEEWRRFETLHCPYLRNRSYSKLFHLENKQMEKFCRTLPLTNQIAVLQPVQSPQAK